MQSNQVQTHINVQVTDRNRKSAFFRWVLIFPVAIFLYSFTSSMHFDPYATGILVMPAGLALLFRGAYPSIEPNPNIAVIIPDVQGGKKLSRGLPLVKWLFAIPLVIIGIVYTFASAMLTIFAWLHVS
jgi:hypothetical protein